MPADLVWPARVVGRRGVGERVGSFRLVGSGRRLPLVATGGIMTAAASPAGPGQPGWVDPELATLTGDRFSDPGWIFERKLDGERAWRSGPGGRSG